MTSKDNVMLTSPLRPLLLKYAIPSIISMIITSIYNIVDQIFLGHGVGYLGNTATNITMPFVTMNLSVTLMISVGCASYMNLALGRGEKESASRACCTAILAGTIFSVVLGCVGIFFTEPLAYMFGATETSIAYATGYMRIIAIGVLFANPTNVLNNIIRADGHPTFSMISISVGAILNCILDPIFIMGFNWGVEGAALATIIGQFVSFLISLLYIRKLKSVEIKKEYFTFKNKELGSIFKQGSSNFILQLSNVVVQVTMNNSLRIWGAQSIYGSDVCIAALGVTMKVNMIIISVILGLGAGQQPIVGYNYGAKNYKRAYDTYKLTTSIAVCISLAGWLVFRIAPNAVIGIFGQADALYNDFATKCLQIYLGGIFLAGFLIPTSNMFQAIGKPTKSVILTLLRQFAVIIPLLLILPKFMGVIGLLYAGLFTDAISFTFSLAFMLKERKEFNRLIAETEIEKL